MVEKMEGTVYELHYHEQNYYNYEVEYGYLLNDLFHEQENRDEPMQDF